jgi:hypothetical protein
MARMAWQKFQTLYSRACTRLNKPFSLKEAAAAYRDPNGTCENLRICLVNNKWQAKRGTAAPKISKKKVAKRKKGIPASKYTPKQADLVEKYEKGLLAGTRLSSYDKGLLKEAGIDPDSIEQGNASLIKNYASNFEKEFGQKPGVEHENVPVSKPISKFEELSNEYERIFGHKPTEYQLKMWIVTDKSPPNKSPGIGHPMPDDLEVKRHMEEKKINPPVSADAKAPSSRKGLWYGRNKPKGPANAPTALPAKKYLKNPIAPNALVPWTYEQSKLRAKIRGEMLGEPMPVVFSDKPKEKTKVRFADEAVATPAVVHKEPEPAPVPYEDPFGDLDNPYPKDEKNDIYDVMDRILYANKGKYDMVVPKDDDLLAYYHAYPDEDPIKPIAQGGGPKSWAKYEEGEGDRDLRRRLWDQAKFQKHVIDVTKNLREIIDLLAELEHFALQEEHAGEVAVPGTIYNTYVPDDKKLDKKAKALQARWEKIEGTWDPTRAAFNKLLNKYRSFVPKQDWKTGVTLYKYNNARRIRNIPRRSSKRHSQNQRNNKPYSRLWQ